MTLIIEATLFFFISHRIETIEYLLFSLWSHASGYYCKCHSQMFCVSIPQRDEYLV